MEIPAISVKGNVEHLAGGDLVSFWLCQILDYVLDKMNQPHSIFFSSFCLHEVDVVFSENQACC